ncbi:hypothetical protein BpHYR1_045703 [Brachionus plicatilis]|uniref:Uncharacterized protein n=1 Tax=Brachionus plicatilis TaxID=10195 RepID=A0A3M7RY19_BRAPC|nr:hypothetical protein BpHYR1_045703 [Brachionus plicatilis]
MKIFQIITGCRSISKITASIHVKKIKSGSILSGECGCTVRIRKNRNQIIRNSGSIRYYPFLNYLAKNIESEICESDLTSNRRSLKDFTKNFVQSTCILVKLKQNNSTLTREVYKSSISRQKMYSISLENLSVSRLASEEDLTDYCEYNENLGSIQREINNLEKLNVHV